MFKRPFSAKTSAPVRSSDLRKLRDELVNSPNRYLLGFNSTATQDPSSSSTTGISSSIAKRVLPDGTLVCKATTHLDEPVTLYSAPDSNPRWFRIGKGGDGLLVPTCYTFDLVHIDHGLELLPTLVTADAVRDHLVSGAALFSAGVSEASLRALPEGMRQGELVPVRCEGSPLIVAVGELAASRSELLSDRKGKAVITLHARGDFLWNSGNGVVPNESSTNEKDESRVSAPDVAQQMQALALQPEPESGATSKSPADELATAPASELTSADVDTLLRNALLLAIRQSLAKTASPFPIPASSLYSTYILPNRPAATPPSADIKKSSFKKLAGFVKSAHKAGLLVSKEVKGELMIMSVNAEHPEVQAMRSYKTMAQASASLTSNSRPATTAAASTSGAGPVVVRELFKPTSAVVPIFQAVDHARPEGDLYSALELKRFLADYVVAQNLTHPRDAAFITLDDVLTSALLKKGEVLDVLKRSDAIVRLQQGCQVWHSIQKEGEDEATFRKGSPPIIKVAIKNVGKRQVTLVSGHEAWGLFSSDELADELKVRSASSTAVQPLVGATKKGQTPKVEIMCQGTHDALVIKLLIARGVPKNYIEVDTSKSKR